MNHELFQCIDAGTENCPCHLAESGNCLTCSRLAGRECVDCQWRGVCIYNEYIQNGKVIKDVRKEQEVAIVEKTFYPEETAIFILDVGKGMAMKCYMPGTYVFLRGKDSELYFNVPISVMHADVEKGLIWVLVKAISAKTKRLMAQSDSLFLRGPYKNGLFGLESLNEIRKRPYGVGLPKIFIIAKGVGIAPTEKMLQFIGDRAATTVFLDKSKISEEVIAACFRTEPTKYCPIDLTRQEDLEKMDMEILTGHYDAICVFTSDYFIARIGKACKELEYQGELLISNNFNICCGEGVCGACSVVGHKGETIKMCKCKLDGEEVLKKTAVFNQ